MASEISFGSVFQRDGVEYSIDVTEREGGFVAAWECKGCSVGGFGSRVCSSADEAVLTAQALLFSEHHLRVHLGGGEPRQRRRDVAGRFCANA